MHERRKTLLINAVQQRRLVMAMLLGAILLVNSLLVLVMVFKPAVMAFVAFGDLAALAGIEILVVACIGYFSLLLSHRIAGPAYALVRDLTRLGKGDLTVRTQLRKGDFHREVADTFNLTVETLGSRIKMVQASLTILEQQADTPPAIRQALQATLRDLAYFTTDPSIHDMPRRAATTHRGHLGLDGPSPLAQGPS